MTQRAIWLGQRLQALRTDADMTLQDVGDYLGRNPSSVSRFESGETPARIGDVIALMNLYGVDDPGERANMEQLAREVWQKGWWDRYRKVAPVLIDYAWMESRASEIRGYDGQLVFGLLQTAEYAEATIRAFDRPPEEELQAGLAARLKRQDVFERREPFVYRTILDEAVLRRPVGGIQTMKAQLRHLIRMADHERVELRVLPFDAGEHKGQLGSFSILTQPYPFTQVGLTESIGGTIFVEAEDVQVFSDAYDLLRDQSLDCRESIKFITHIEEDLG